MRLYVLLTALLVLGCGRGPLTLEEQSATGSTVGSAGPADIANPGAGPSAGTTGGNPQLVVMKDHYADPSALALCQTVPVLLDMQGNRVKLSGGEFGGDMRVNLQTGKSVLNLTNYPVGTYSGFVVTLSTACRNGVSLAMQNSYSTFTAKTVMVLTFDGVISIAAGSTGPKPTKVTLDFTPTLRALAAVTAATEIPAAVNGSVNTVK